MNLMDDALFRLWRDEKCTVEDCLGKAHTPDDLAKRIVNAKRGVADEMPGGNDLITGAAPQERRTLTRRASPPWN
jgi:Tfp pilus assembly ATPase PilU